MTSTPIPCQYTFFFVAIGKTGEADVMIYHIILMISKNPSAITWTEQLPDQNELGNRATDETRNSSRPRPPL
jgi:hypothetical protein